MKYLKTDSVLGTVGQPFKSGSPQHLQNALIENSMGILKGLFPALDPEAGKLYVIQGARNIGILPDIFSFNGVIMTVDDNFNWIMYLYQGGHFIPSDTGIIIKKETFFTASNADPVTLTDGSTANVHSIVNMKLVDGNSSTPGYVCDYADLIYLVDAWHNIGAADEPAFAHSWVNYGSGAQDLQYIKTDYRTVKIRGTVRSGTLAQSIFTLLDSTYFPPAEVSGTIVLNGGTGSITITAAGVVTLRAISGGDNTFAFINFEYNLD